MTRPAIYLPYRGEFGHKVMWHVPWVHSQPGPKIVCCESGEESLYPSASDFIFVDRKSDELRREWSQYDDEFVTALEKSVKHLGATVRPLRKYPEDAAAYGRFVPQPCQHHQIRCDVVICPRRRGYGPSKNWEHWDSLARELERHVSIFAGGTPDGSSPVPCLHAWAYDRFLDATIEAMLAARLVVATDSGLAHLALLCGRPLLLITDKRGDTAPGYGLVKWRRYDMANHRRVPIMSVQNSWHDWRSAFNKTMEFLATND